MKLKTASLSLFSQNKYFRLYNAINTRIEALRIQSEIILKKRKHLDLRAYEKDIKILKGLKHRLVINPHITNKEKILWLCEKKYLRAYAGFKRFPKKVSDHSCLLFDGYFPKKCMNKLKIEYLNSQLKYKMKIGKKVVDIKEKRNIIKALAKLYFVEEVKKKLHEDTRLARLAELKIRLEYEVSEKTKLGWFMVFDTLTVEGSNYDSIFNVGSRSWNIYINSINRSVGIAYYRSWRKAIEARKHGESWHTYFSVIERGSENGRMHIHVIHFMRVLPYNCVDPNVGLNVPLNREIDGFKRFWQYGFSTPIAVRYSDQDAFGKIGWRYPAVMEENVVKGCPMNDPIAVCYYMTKYLTKEIQNEKEHYTWRIRLTRGLGTKVLSSYSQTLSMKEKRVVLAMESSGILKIREKSIPLTLLKRIVMKSYLTKMISKIPFMTLKYLKTLKPTENIVVRLKSIMKIEDLFTKLNIGNSMTKILNGEVISKMQKRLDIIVINVLGLVQPYVKVTGNFRGEI